jgi:hypothetical protein
MCTVFSSSMLMSVMPKVLSRVMLEMVDMGATLRSSMTVYVTTLRTSPFFACGCGFRFDRLPRPRHREKTHLLVQIART